MPKSLISMSLSLSGMILPMVTLAACSAIVLRPNQQTDVANGTRVFWCPGGLNIGGQHVLAVGHPNTLARGDRALMRFDLSHLINEGKIRQAKLFFAIPMIFGRYDTRRLQLEHFTEECGNLALPDIISPSVEPLNMFEIDRKGKLPAAIVLDVTGAVNADLSKGWSNITFRIKDAEAEKQGNPDNAPTGSAIMVESIKLEILK